MGKNEARELCARTRLTESWRDQHRRTPPLNRSESLGAGHKENGEPRKLNPVKDADFVVYRESLWFCFDQHRSTYVPPAYCHQVGLTHWQPRKDDVLPATSIEHLPSTSIYLHPSAHVGLQRYFDFNFESSDTEPRTNDNVFPELVSLCFDELARRRRLRTQMHQQYVAAASLACRSTLSADWKIIAVAESRLQRAFLLLPPGRPPPHVSTRRAVQGASVSSDRSARACAGSARWTG